MKERKFAASLAAVVAISYVMPFTAEASTNFDLRKRVIGITGIMTVTDTTSQVTRAEFAAMLVNATSYKSTVTEGSNTSVFADVPQNHTYASQIRIAAQQGWMTGYLGGNFYPDRYITLQEAARGVLALLSYTNEDFTGDQAGARISKYHYLELDEGISREASEILNKEDCINLFYNLLKTDMKTGNQHYGSVLGVDLTSDGEVNPLTLADNSLKGPIVVKRSYSLSDYVPFEVRSANLFLDGNASSYDAIKNAIEDNGYVVVYFNTGTKTIWAYSENGGQTDRAVVRGEISHIYYGSANVMTPSGVEIDGVTYKLESSEMQFAFSMYGTIGVGDQVALIYTISSSGDGTETYTVIDYLEY